MPLSRDVWTGRDLPPWLPAELTEREARTLAPFTPARDGWVRWYEGKARYVCGKSTPLGEVEDRWADKRKQIDADRSGEPIAPARGSLPYRQVLGEFLSHLQGRINARRNRLRERTYHNYVKELNAFGDFVVDGLKIADHPIGEIGPRQFTAYARQFSGWKASAFDSVVSRVLALFRWAAEMEHIDRVRPGPAFVRPAKQDLRDERIDLAKSFTPEQVATLYLAANPTMRCWVALGICAAFNNADVANLARGEIDWDEGMIDFRRRKTGRVRRVIPLPADVLDLLRKYDRPEPADAAHGGLFFLTENGLPYSRTRSRKGNWMPNCSISRLTAKLMVSAGLRAAGPGGDGRNFSGLRTTFFNLAPRGEWELERKIIMGRAQGTIDLDSYLEDVGVDRLSHVVTHVWSLVKAQIDRISNERQGAAAPSPERPWRGGDRRGRAKAPAGSGSPAPAPRAAPGSGGE